MIALALAATVASPLAEPFWERDLGALSRALAEARLAGNRVERVTFFDDLLRLVRCEPLEELATNDEDELFRGLLRLEVARRARLGDADVRAPTIWRDVLVPGFFRTDTGDPARDGAELVWPADEERWPDERLVVGALGSRCGDPRSRRRGTELPSARQVTELAKAGEAAASARLAYQRAVLLARAGRDADWRIAARSVTPDLLDPALAPHARLLRAEAGADLPEAYLSLVDAELGDTWLAAAVRAADLHARAGRVREALAIAERAAEFPCDGPRAAGVRALRFHRASALALTGRREEVGPALLEAVRCAVPGADPHAAPLRELAIAIAGTLGYAEAEEILAAASGAGGAADVLWGYGRAALSAGNVRGADDAARALGDTPAARARGIALAAEVAFARGDAVSFEAEAGRLLAAKVAARERADRDRLALELASAVAVRHADEPRPDRAAALGRVLDRIEAAVPLSRAPALARIREAVRNAARSELVSGKGALPLALGVVAVSARPEPPPLPKVPISWPEPRSLLAIPAPGGGTRDWFPTATSEGSTR